MHIHIGPARFRHDEAKTLLLIEKLNVSITHCAGGLTRTAGWAGSGPWRLAVPGGGIDAVYVRDLHTPLALRHVAKNGCALWQFGRRQSGKRRCVTERVGTIFQRYEAKTLCRIKPFHGRPLRSGTGSGTRLIKLCHVPLRLTPCP